VKTTLESWLAELLAAIPVHLRKRRLHLGFSGGLDSTVLLHGLLALQRAGELDELGLLHVHHGLQPEADAWAERAQGLGLEFGLPVKVLRVTVDRQAGQGVEAAAREARYQAFASVMAAGDVLLTAHHLDDQAETFMLQLMRGAGVRGLSAMPRLQPFALSAGDAQSMGWHVRPLLHVTRQDLEHVAMQMNLTWVDDPSNADTRFARNLVRNEVLPRLQQHWPQATQTLARCAERMALSEGLLLDLARLDLEPLRGENVQRLCVHGLTRLSVARMENAVRAWLLELGMPAPPASRLQELQRVLLARDDALPKLAWPGGVLRRWRGGLYALSETHEQRVDWPGCVWDLQQPLAISALALRLHATWERGSGLQSDRLKNGLHVCLRHASSLPSASSRATLSKRLQELGVPPWLRSSLPLFYVDATLVQISDLWVAPAYAVQAQEMGVVIRVERVT